MRRFAVNKIGDAIATSGTTFAADADPQLVREAVPFSLKLIESLLAESPKHPGLLLAASRSFTQYTYAFVQQDADEIEDHDLAASNEMRARAKRLYLRARDYGLRGLELKHPAFTKALRTDPLMAVWPVKKSEVALIYWTAASWGAAISVSKNDPELIADQPIVEALIDHALRLDERFESGSIHGFLINYEQARQGAAEDAALRSKKHFDRALELSGGQLASPLVSYAEAVCIGKQNRSEFESLLKRAIAVDTNARPEWQLENLVMQRRARWLLGKVDDLFLNQPTPED
jgi:predicted anti-sigma-YlaC factor YlaD